jgi:hypothetical protein
MSKAKAAAKKQNMQFKVIKLLTTVAALNLAFLVFSLFHYCVFASDGIGLPGMLEIGRALHYISETLLLLVTLNLSMGMYVSTNSVPSFRPLYLFCAFYLLLQLSLGIWDAYVRDPAAVVYLYDSLPGYLLIILRICALVQFWRSLRHTIVAEQERTRKDFYSAFSILGSLWFLALPFTVAVAELTASNMRAKVVFAVSSTVEFILLALYFWLFRPWGNQYVPILRNDRDRAFGGTAQGQIFPHFGGNADGDLDLTSLVQPMGSVTALTEV